MFTRLSSKLLWTLSAERIMIFHVEYTGGRTHIRGQSRYIQPVLGCQGPSSFCCMREGGRETSFFSFFLHHVSKTRGSFFSRPEAFTKLSREAQKHRQTGLASGNEQIRLKLAPRPPAMWLSVLAAAARDSCELQIGFQAHRPASTARFYSLTHHICHLLIIGLFFDDISQAKSAAFEWGRN